MVKNKFKPIYPYPKGSKEYYRDALYLILVTAVDYDGWDTNDAGQMKELVDDLVAISSNALADEALYFEEEK